MGVTVLLDVPDGLRSDIDPGISRALILVLLSFVIILSGAAIVSVGQSPAANPSEGVVGDCSRLQAANAPYLFLVTTPDGFPVPNVTITANGIGGVTNSSGVAILLATNITSFETRVAGTSSSASLSEYKPPVLCLGDSYYRLVSLSANVTSATDP